MTNENIEVSLSRQIEEVAVDRYLVDRPMTVGDKTKPMGFQECVRSVITETVQTKESVAQFFGELVIERELPEWEYFSFMQQRKYEGWLDFAADFGSEVIADESWKTRPDVWMESDRRDGSEPYRSFIVLRDLFRDRVERGDPNQAFQDLAEYFKDEDEMKGVTEPHQAFLALKQHFESYEELEEEPTSFIDFISQ
jgi:hypothetical protein